MRTPSWLQSFFILCSGADREILLQCPTEWNKYAGIGATIFFTGILASISGGYALFTIFRGADYAWFYALLFGLTWGFVIFNLDRFIVSSIRKEGNFRKEFLQAAPRFILAIIISIVIAKPLEVRIFESRIEQQILEDKRKKLEEGMGKGLAYTGLPNINERITQQEEKIAALQSELKTDPPIVKELRQEKKVAENDLKNIKQKNFPQINNIDKKTARIENDSNNYQPIISFGTVTQGPMFPEKEKEIANLKATKKKLNDEVKSQEEKVFKIGSKIQEEIKKHNASIEQQLGTESDKKINAEGEKEEAESRLDEWQKETENAGNNSYTNNFITQLEAMGNLTASNSTMAWTSWMIMLLFIVIEIAPILVKLMSKRGPYEEILERVEYEHFIREKEVISRWNSKINELLIKANEAAKLEGEMHLAVEKQRLEHELRNNQTILDDLAQKQEHLAKIAIDKWYKDELDKINANNGPAGVKNPSNGHGVTITP
jgi:hypothetical protein